MREDAWKPLLSAALGVLDDLRARGFGAPSIVLGGGTVLMMRLQHRLTNDIDLFLHEAQWLGLLTPRLNDYAAALAASDAEQANSLKLALLGGDIDFVVAGSVTGIAPNERLDFEGWSLPLESTAEILAKKLYFRAGLLKPRDIFALMATFRSNPQSARRAVRPRRSCAPAVDRRGRGLAFARLVRRCRSAHTAASGVAVRHRRSDAGSRLCARSANRACSQR